MGPGLSVNLELFSLLDLLASERPDPSQSWETCYKHELLHLAISVCFVSVLVLEIGFLCLTALAVLELIL